MGKPKFTPLSFYFSSSSSPTVHSTTRSSSQRKRAPAFRRRRCFVRSGQGEKSSWLALLTSSLLTRTHALHIFTLIYSSISGSRTTNHEPQERAISDVFCLHRARSQAIDFTSFSVEIWQSEYLFFFVVSPTEEIGSFWTGLHL